MCGSGISIVRSNLAIASVSARSRLAKDRDGTSVWNRLWQPAKARARHTLRRRFSGHNNWTTVLDKPTRDRVVDRWKCIQRMYDEPARGPDGINANIHTERLHDRGKNAWWLPMFMRYRECRATKPKVRGWREPPGWVALHSGVRRFCTPDLGIYRNRSPERQRRVE